MAKNTQRKERASLVSPKGTRVTVAKDSAARYTAKGYKAAGGVVDTPLEPKEDPKGADPGAAGAKGSEPAPEPDSSDAKGAPERPSRGASLAAWAEFAKAVGFEHDEKASRDEIRDAYEAAHPAE